jgi:hypothetical protein
VAENPLREMLRGGPESRAREFKQSMSWENPQTVGKVVKWALGAANLQDGGTLAFGLERQGALYVPIGMSKSDYDSFDHDAVSSTVNTHATPHIDLSVEHIPLETEERLFVVIAVRQFVDYPVICAKDFVVEGKAIVIKGRIYCRSRRTPETTEIQTPEDMREVIELATNRGLERYFRQRQIEGGSSSATAEQQFRNQMEDLL